MNDCYELKSGNQTCIYDPIKDLEISIEQQVGDNAYKYCMYYTPPIRDCIAVELMTCAPDSFNTGNCVIILGKNEALTLEFSVGLTNDTKPLLDIFK